MVCKLPLHNRHHLHQSLPPKQKTKRHFFEEADDPTSRPAPFPMELPVELPKEFPMELYHRAMININKSIPLQQIIENKVHK